MFNLIVWGHEINDIEGHGDIIYVAGLFTFEYKNFTYKNIAKYNLRSNQWVPIQNLLPGPINSLCLGSVGLNASMYAVGVFETDNFQGIAGCNEDGQWTDSVFGGFPSNLEITQIVFINGKQAGNNFTYKSETFYMISSTLDYENPTTAVYKYDGSSLTSLSVEGVRLLQVIDLNNTGTSDS
jgi:hypothetical protein